MKKDPLKDIMKSFFDGKFNPDSNLLFDIIPSDVENGTGSMQKSGWKSRYMISSNLN